MPDDRCSPAPLAPDFELIDGGRTERIGRRQHHGFPLLLVIVRELADGRRLADAIYADDERRSWV